MKSIPNFPGKYPRQSTPYYIERKQGYPTDSLLLNLEYVCYCQLQKARDMLFNKDTKFGPSKTDCSLQEMERWLTVDKLTGPMIEYTRDCEEYWGSKDNTKTDRDFFMKARKKTGDGSWLFRVAEQIGTRIEKWGHFERKQA